MVLRKDQDHVLGQQLDEGQLLTPLPLGGAVRVDQGDVQVPGRERTKHLGREPLFEHDLTTREAVHERLLTAPGSRCWLAVPKAPTRMLPAQPCEMARIWSRSRSRAISTSLERSAIWRATGVGCTLCARRSKSSTLHVRSSAAICWETAEGEYPRSRAAPENDRAAPPQRASATARRSSR